MTTKLNANYYNEKLSIKLGSLVKVRFQSARYYRHDDRIVNNKKDLPEEGVSNQLCLLISHIHL